MILPIVDPAGGPLSSRGLADGARRLEAHGFDSVWAFDAIGRGFVLPDPLIAVAVAATVTERVEVGIGVLQVPLRRPVELAHRILTAHLVAGGRFVLGVGAGSTEADFAAVGADYATRFAELAAALPLMRALWRGERVGDADLTPWPAANGGPAVLIGSWAGGRWIERAATEYDGWIASAAKTSVHDLREGIRRFRDLGGQRAVVTNVTVDLRKDGGAVEAADRLAVLAKLGFDDAVLLSFDQRDETLAEIRSFSAALGAGGSGPR